ncbi:MAG: hypothetical protein R2695_11015 [Acidimicrobiales bacterium]
MLDHLRNEGADRSAWGFDQGFYGGPVPMAAVQEDQAAGAGDGAAPPSTTVPRRPPRASTSPAPRCRRPVSTKPTS